MWLLLDVVIFVAHGASAVVQWFPAVPRQVYGVGQEHFVEDVRRPPPEPDRHLSVYPALHLVMVRDLALPIAASEALRSKNAIPWGSPLSFTPDEIVFGYILHSTGEAGPAFVLKDPYMLDFLDLKDHYLERAFEDAILRESESFLPELGRAFPLSPVWSAWTADADLILGKIQRLSKRISN
jgi:hypothetical protein